MKIKRCPQCKILKPITEFYKDKSTQDGLQCWCKKCKLDYEYLHYNKAKNTEKYRKYKARKKIPKHYQI